MFAKKVVYLVYFKKSVPNEIPFLGFGGRDITNKQ